MAQPPSISSQLLPLIPISLALILWGYFALRRARRFPPIDLSAPQFSENAGLSLGLIRRRGWRMLGIGSAGFAAMLFLVYWLAAHAYSFHFALLPACFPFVFLCAGLTEAITGTPYSRLAQRWMSLRGWQRGVIGTSIVLAALITIMCTVTFFVMLFT
jgi:hypothetical protein